MLSKMIVQTDQTKPVKICGVCGDRAKSYHFGGISCDSCKAFFRRSVQNDAHRTFQCSFQSRCDITMANRKCCQHCRFRKCIDIGMETTWVMTEEERVNMLQARMWKRRVPLTNLRRHSTINGSGVVGEVKREKSRVRQRRSTPPRNLNDKDTEDGEGDDNDGHRFRDSPVSSVNDVDIDIDDSSCSSRKRIKLSSESPLKRQILMEVPSVEEDLFSDIERTEIDVIFNAFHECFQSKTDLKSAVSDCTSKWLLVVIFIFSIQRLVRFARSLDKFSRLLIKDQVTLLRSNIFELFLIVHLCDIVDDASTLSQSPPNKRCPFLAAAMPGNDVRGSTKSQLSDNESRESIGTIFRSAIQGDSTTLVLLLLIVLFCPDSAELTNPKDIESHQIHYCNLLGRHLRQKSKSLKFAAQSISTLPKLLLLLPILREMREKHMSFHFDLSDADVEFTTNQSGMDSCLADFLL